MLGWDQRWCEDFAMRASAMWEERADQTDMEVCPGTAGECCNRDTVGTLSWYATVGKIRTEQEFEMFRAAS